MEQSVLTRRGMLTGGAAVIGFMGAGCGRAQTATDAGFSTLWPSHGKPELRGATIAQRRRDATIDGEGGANAYKYLIPHYTLPDFEALAATGANLVNLSVPGVWHTEPPYDRDQHMVDALMTMLEACRAADLYVTVGFRSGPGRSEFIFHRDSAGSWFPAELIVDEIWRNPDAQVAWSEMCVDAAGLLTNRPEIAGLTPLVEPEPEMAGVDKSVWSGMCWKIVSAIRAVAPELPLLISPAGFANPANLDVMGTPNAAGIVWNVHDYGPFEYTHQDSGRHSVTLPGEDAGAFADGLNNLKQIGGGLPIFMGEFGAVHWAPELEGYWRNRITALEAAGINWSAFRWRSTEANYEMGDNDFTLGQHGLPGALASGWKQSQLSHRPASGQARQQGLLPRLSGED